MDVDLTINSQEIVNYKLHLDDDSAKHISNNSNDTEGMLMAIGVSESMAHIIVESIKDTEERATSSKSLPRLRSSTNGTPTCCKRSDGLLMKVSGPISLSKLMHKPASVREAFSESSTSSKNEMNDTKTVAVVTNGNERRDEENSTKNITWMYRIFTCCSSF